MIGTVLAILGIIITIAFGIYSIWAYKRNKKKVSIEFKSKECYSLFSDDVSRLNIELSYNKKPLSSALILLKAEIINNGQVDIDKNRIYKPFKIISAKEFKWLESRITFQPSGATTNIVQNTQNEIQIEWDLLKAKEHIEIEALIEIENEDNIDGDKASNFFKGIIFDYRITDLNTIHKEGPVSKPEDIFKNKFSNFLIPMSLIVGLYIFISSLFPTINFFSVKEIEYLIKNDTTIIYGNVLMKNNNVVVLKFTNSDEKTKMSLKEFNEKYKIERIEKADIAPNETKTLRITGIVYFFMGVLLWIITSKFTKNLVIRKRRRRKALEKQNIGGQQ